jgi:hypothetical protein
MIEPQRWGSGPQNSYSGDLSKQLGIAVDSLNCSVWWICLLHGKIFLLFCCIAYEKQYRKQAI